MSFTVHHLSLKANESRLSVRVNAWAMSWASRISRIWLGWPATLQLGGFFGFILLKLFSSSWRYNYII